jgi:hypothetical protein
VNGQRYDVSTRCTTEAAAFAALERFEKDPEGFHPGGDPGTAPLYLDNELAKRFLAWSKAERGNSPGWVGKQKLLLADWMGTLRGVNPARGPGRGGRLSVLARRSRRGSLRPP